MALRIAKPRNPVETAARNDHEAKSVKLANKENCPEPAMSEMGVNRHVSRKPLPIKCFKAKSVPDFKKLYQDFHKKQSVAKKPCTQPVPFNFSKLRGAKSTGLSNKNQTVCENARVLSSTVTREELPESEESHPVGAKCMMAGMDPAAVETIQIQNQDSEGLLQEKLNFDPSNSNLKLLHSWEAKKEKRFGLWEMTPTPGKTKNPNIQNSAQKINPPFPAKEKSEYQQNETIETGNRDGDFVSNPMALQSIRSNVGIGAFNSSGKPSLANGVSMKRNTQNPELSNLNSGNCKSTALGSALSAVGGRNTFGVLCGKPSMIIHAPAKDSLHHCKYRAQNPFAIRRSPYMPSNHTALPFAFGRASIAEVDTNASIKSLSNGILQPLKLYNQVNHRHHFSSKKSAIHKPDGPRSNLIEGARESSSHAATPLISAGVSCIWKPDAKQMKTPDGAIRPSNLSFSSTLTPSENLWHPRCVLAPPSSVDQVVLRLFNGPDNPNEVGKAPETLSLKQRSEGRNYQESPAILDRKLEKLKEIELLAQLLQKGIQEVKIIEETDTESCCDASVPILSEHPILACASMKSSPVATALKQQELERHVLPSDCIGLTSNQTPLQVNCSVKIDHISGPTNNLCTIDHQSDIMLPSTEPPLNVMETWPTPVGHSLARLLTTAQPLKFQSPFCRGNTGSPASGGFGDHVKRGCLGAV
ncbi:uncharacterized protein [Narcine bancroftii]|uniref:uncharacterized protein isoform X2 n=1 Tax=Narcine bancroftii TaxID=1343680 RepID=UPI003831BB87